MAAPAQAATSGSLVAGPSIVAGGALEWLEGDLAGWKVRSERGGSVGTLASGRLRSSEDTESGDVTTESVGEFAAAADATAVETRLHSGSTKVQIYTDSSTVRLYSAHPPRPLATCSAYRDLFNGPGPNTPPSPTADIATDGTHVAVSLCGETKVFDLAGGAGVVQPAGSGLAVKIAGPFIASQAGNGVVVRDWRTTAEVYRAPFPAGTQRVAWDLQADGALAIAGFTSMAPGCATGVLSWHTPTAPAGAKLPVAPCTAEVAVDGGRAVVVAAAGTGRTLAEAGADGTRRDLAWIGSGAARAGGLDYADGVAAYALTRCGGRVELLRSTGEAEPQAVECPRLVLKRASRRGRTLRVRATVAPAVTARVMLAYRIAGRTVRRSLAPRRGVLSLDLRLPARAGGRRGTLTLTFPGDGTYVRQIVRR